MLGKQNRPALDRILNDYLARLASEGVPLEILILGENIEDGIGDFFHVFEFYKFLSERFRNNPGIKIKALVFISECKLNSVEKILGSEFSEHATKYNSELNEATFNDNEDPRFVCCTSNSQETVDALLKKFTPHSKIILAYTQLSEGFEESSSYYCLQHKQKENPDLLLYAIGEYGRDTKRITINGKFYTDQGMGPLPWQAGIKYYPDLLKTATLSHEQKKFNLHSIENQEIRNLLAQDQHAFLGCGYIQDSLLTTTFIRTFTAIAPMKKNAILFINIKHCMDIKFRTLKESLRTNLEDLGKFGKVQVISKTGNVLAEASLDKELTTNGSTLNLIDFSDLSQNDKKLLLQASECVAASGDNSFSEMISTDSFPFFAFPNWKNAFIEQILNDVIAHKPESYALHSYLDRIKDSMSKKCNKDLSKTLENMIVYVTENYVDILEQWKSYSDNTKNKMDRCYDVNDKLNFIVDLLIFSSITYQGRKEEKSTLFENAPELLEPVIQHGSETLLSTLLDHWPKNHSPPAFKIDWIAACLPPRGSGNCLNILLNHPIFCDSIPIEKIIDLCLGDIIRKENIKESWYDDKSSWITTISPRNKGITDYILQTLKIHKYSPILDSLLKISVVALLTLEKNKPLIAEKYFKQIKNNLATKKPKTTAYPSTLFSRSLEDDRLMVVEEIIDCYNSIIDKPSTNLNPKKRKR